MADNTINQGGTLLNLAIHGFLKTVVRATTTPFAIQDTYRLKKSVDIEFNLSPAFELRYNDDGAFDPVPNGDVGTWVASLPLTADVVSTTAGKSITTNTDKNTITYWFHELFNKRFPPIEFDQESVDTQGVAQQVNIRFKGFLMGMRTTRTEAAGVYNIELSGIMRPDTTAEVAVDVVAEVLKTAA